jgi:hypothetical protein
MLLPFSKPLCFSRMSLELLEASQKYFMLLIACSSWNSNTSDRAISICCSRARVDRVSITRLP